MKVETFADGYIEWNGHDEDGAVEGFAEIDSAQLENRRMTLSFESDGAEYSATLELDDEKWTGKYRRRDPGVALPAVGRCWARETTLPEGDKTFVGRWMEHEIGFAWTLVLRGVAPATRTKPGPSAQPPIGHAPLVPKVDEQAKQKIRRVARALDDLAEGRSVSPQLLDEALRLHSILFRGEKRGTPKKWP